MPRGHELAPAKYSVKSCGFSGGAFSNDARLATRREQRLNLRLA